MEYLIPYASCTFTKGATRTLIADYNRKKFFFISNQYYEILILLKNEPLPTFLSKYSKEDQLEINRFVTFLLENECCHITNSPDRYPQISNTWQDYPGQIRSAIVEFRGGNANFHQIIEQLDNLGCTELQLRVIDNVSIDTLKDLCNIIKNTDVNYLEIYIIYNDALDEKDLRGLLKSHAILSKILIYLAPEDKKITDKTAPSKFYPIVYGKIIYTSLPIDCGVINLMTLSNSLESLENYFEHQNHNGCLNKKISIDANGEIRNCPHMKQSYGNIQSTKLTDVLENKEFRSYWDISKDRISKCRDCEFRYNCSDCRAFTEKESKTNDFEKPLKCGYDPYKAEWIDITK